MNEKQQQKELDTNFIRTTKPSKATSNDQYSLVQETSDDFIDLRRVLVVAPLLKKNLQGTESSGDLSFQGSIFQTMLNEKQQSEQENNDLSIRNKVQFKDRDALMHTEDKSDQNQSDMLLAHERHQIDQSNRGQPSQKLEDYWDRFNKLLLKFLNNYIKQVKINEEQISEVYGKGTNKENDGNMRQNRRSSTVDKSTTVSDLSDKSTRHLLTFACMAQDANPMSNLTFDWSFGSINLPETGAERDYINPDLGVDGEQEFIKPLLVYVNENYTLHISLVRRLDTRLSLNPFQMSLLTLNVVVVESSSLGQFDPSITRITRQALLDNSILNRTLHNPALSPRAPIRKNRYQALYNSLKANQNNNNVQFAHDFDTKPYNLSPTVELTEKNWQEQIGNLVKCTVANQIGTSEVCHVRVNLAERMKSQASSSEFAKWRMPLLGQKSLLIISLLIGCALIVFVISALLLGPHIRGLNLKKGDDGRMCKEENNTGQSTSSQKSSVLGLLGNGDSSLQGSSDDDSSARLNHLDNENRILHEARMLNGVDNPMNGSASNGYQHHNQLLREPALNLNYDKPRGLQQAPTSRMIYHPNQFNEMSQETCDSYQMNPREHAGTKPPTNKVSETLTAPEPKNSRQPSAGSRLLANLRFKSLSKFKVDRISDLSNFTSRMDNLRSLHTRNLSNTETNTTGLSASALDSAQSSSKKGSLGKSSESPSFFGAPSLRSSHTGFKLAAQQQQSNNTQLDPSYYLYDQNGLQCEQDSHCMQATNSRGLLTASLTPMRPTYSNMIPTNQINVLDEFVGRRDIEPAPQLTESDTFFRSHSGRNMDSSNQPFYLVKNDLNQFQPHQYPTRGPPVFPRTNQHSTLYGAPGMKDARPPVMLRSSHKHVPASANMQYQSSRDNRYSMPAYNQTFGNNRYPIPTVSYMNTIDSHLNRMVDNIVMNQYSNQDQQHIAYANAAEVNPYVYNDVTATTTAHNQSTEHIYDTNAYATPEHQTPLKRPESVGQQQSTSGNERLRVSQLIQTFNSKLPE